MSLKHLSDAQIIEAATDPHVNLNALVVDILSGKHGHADLVALVFRMGETIVRLDDERTELMDQIDELEED